MQEKYNSAEIEKSVQSYWNTIDAYKTVEHAKNKTGQEKEKYYTCSMLPYPSGKLHMGHVRNYTINDVIYRYMRMRGYNVLMPMGWDAFGMPAENAAMANGLSPAQWTYKNISYMKKQLQRMGLAIDWSREITACTPEYYKWNQWIFLKMLDRGLIYRKTGTVNWDPIDKTVLANEQVVDGRGWRSGALIEKREIPMYYAKITNYAEELLESLETKLQGWPKRVRLMQAKWIGKSVGIRFAFLHKIKENDKLIQDGKLWVFTTRADTIKGVTFCAIAPEHDLATLAAKSNPDLAKFIAECKNSSIIEAEVATMEKKGIFTGLYVSHPLTGIKIEVWVGNYVSIKYGEGAVMGVPAHDARDFAFAKKYMLPISPVINVKGKVFSEEKWNDWYESVEHSICINSGKYDGLCYQKAVDAVTNDLKACGLGEKKTIYRLRDWGISRQRYWGTPIPIIHCFDCGEVSVPEKDLPVVLPENCIPDGSGNSLNKHEEFLNVTCPKCHRLARRETDTLDTFVDSSWYYMRYCSSDNNMSMIDERSKYWMPIDQYIGGVEHAVLHLMYARFWTKVMRDLGLVSFDEPFTNMLTQGMVLSETYFCEDSSGKKVWHNPEDVILKSDSTGRIISASLKGSGEPIKIGGTEKMSKSKNNGIDPQKQIDEYGADTARLFSIFASPPEQSMEWSNKGVESVNRFLCRLWTFSYMQKENIVPNTAADNSGWNDTHKNLRGRIYKIFQQADYDIKRIQYNTVVSACMKMLNTLEAAHLDLSPASSSVLTEGLSILLRVLNPITPHITHAIWQELGFASVHGDILDSDWPKVDDKALEQSKFELIIQVNGKLRGKIIVDINSDRQTIEEAALANENVKKYIKNYPKKIVLVPKKLVNIVV